MFGDREDLPDRRHQPFHPRRAKRLCRRPRLVELLQPELSHRARNHGLCQLDARLSFGRVQPAHHQPAAFLAISRAAAGSPAFDDERVDSYEVGLKFRTTDQRGVLNLAAYRTDVARMQREINVASATSGLAQSVYNTRPCATGAARQSAGGDAATLPLAPTGSFINVRIRGLPDILAMAIGGGG